MKTSKVNKSGPATAKETKRASKKTPTSSNAKTKKNAREKKPVLKHVELPHGEDMYMIPVKGERHPTGIKEKTRAEKAFKHNEEIALHREQQKVKQITGTNRFKQMFNRSR